MIAAAVIASGFSRRMGRSKLTLRLGGRSFLERAVVAAATAECVGRRLVVLRPEDASLAHALDLPSVELLLNPDAAQGQSASIRLAAAHLAADPDCEAVIFSVVDQPLLTPAIFDTLASAWLAGAGEILVSSYAGQRGNPVLFDRAFFAELQALTGDVGGRVLLQRHPDAVREIAMPDPRAGRDVDTWEEFQEAERLLGSPSAGEGATST